MWTTVLAFLILFMDFITFAADAFGALMLVFEEVPKNGARSIQIPRDGVWTNISRP
jgi:hypothetical protein